MNFYLIQHDCGRQKLELFLLVFLLFTAFVSPLVLSRGCLNSSFVNNFFVERQLFVLCFGKVKFVIKFLFFIYLSCFLSILYIYLIHLFIYLFFYYFPPSAIRRPFPHFTASLHEVVVWIDKISKTLKSLYPFFYSPFSRPSVRSFPIPSPPLNNNQL